MATEKPKLTKEQACEIWGLTNGTCEGFLNALELSGYMEKQETALERAERLYSIYQNNDSYSVEVDVHDLTDIVEAYREALKERPTAKLTEQ